MYARQPPDRKYPRSVRVPHNYSGNAFRREDPLIAVSEAEEETRSAIPPMPTFVESDLQTGSAAENDPAPPVGSVLSTTGAKAELSKLFGNGIGLEELLILGIIFLVSQSDTKDDLVFLLLLLLFIQ